jgi:hypothetical protein
MVDLSRRTAMAAIGAAGLAGAAPATASAVQATVVARLMAERTLALGTREATAAAERAAGAGYDATRPPLPDGLRLTWRDLYALQVPEDEWIGDLPPQGGKERYTIALDDLREWSAQLAEKPGADPKRAARVHHMLALAERHKIDDDAAYEASGQERAIGAATEAYLRVRELEDAIMIAPASCPADVTMKAEIIEGYWLKGKARHDYIVRLIADVRAFAPERISI